MKSVNYILSAEGGAARTAGRRALPHGEDKVVDLAAWRAENLAVPNEAETGRAGAPGRYGGREPVRRRKMAASDWAELAATLAVAAVLAALAVRVLLF